jgi:hypothetical protein
LHKSGIRSPGKGKKYKIRKLEKEGSSTKQTGEARPALGLELNELTNTEAEKSSILKTEEKAKLSQNSSEKNLHLIDLSSQIDYTHTTRSRNHMEGTCSTTTAHKRKYVITPQKVNQHYQPLTMHNSTLYSNSRINTHAHPQPSPPPPVLNSQPKVYSRKGFTPNRNYHHQSPTNHDSYSPSQSFISSPRKLYNQSNQSMNNLHQHINNSQLFQHKNETETHNLSQNSDFSHFNKFEDNLSVKGNSLAASSENKDSKGFLSPNDTKHRDRNDFSFGGVQTQPSALEIVVQQEREKLSQSKNYTFALPQITSPTFRQQGFILN